MTTSFHFGICDRHGPNARKPLPFPAPSKISGNLRDSVTGEMGLSAKLEPSRTASMEPETGSTGCKILTLSKPEALRGALQNRDHLGTHAGAVPDVKETQHG